VIQINLSGWIIITRLAWRRSRPSLDCRQRAFIIEAVGIATVVVSVAVLAVILFSVWW